MSAPFASKLFENSSNNTDGWDDWDNNWVDNNNVSNATKGPQQTQFIQQPAQMDFSPAQNMQPQRTDNAANYFNPTSQIPPPTMDHSSMQSLTTSGQFTAVQPNNNHINSTGVFYQDNNSTQYQHQDLFVNNNQSANNNFVQSAMPNYQHVQNSNSIGFMQIESYEGTVPPVPPRTPLTDFSAIQNVPSKAKTVSGVTPFSNTQVQCQQAPSIESSNVPNVPVFNNNALPAVLPPPSLNQPSFANTNPFKRVGSHAHRTPPPPPLSAKSLGNTSAEILTNQTSSTQRVSHSLETNEPITHNDRNEYLQTGHLSEDGENNVSVSNSETQVQYSSSDGNGDSLPPPGLSRFVLGEQETNESNNVQPPPGLDRLVTGTEINQSDINLERQADGQDNADTSVPQVIRNNNQFSSVQTLSTASNLSQSLAIENQSYENDGYEPISESDRNQYLVAGENVVDNTNATVQVQNLSNANIQRVVTGLENVENQDLNLPERQRELDLDGENIEDNQQQQQQQQQRQQQQQQQQQQSQSRFASATNTLSQADSVEELDTSGNYNQKIQSNPSSGDDSDREKAYYSRNKAQTSRRGEERRKKRDESKYETEDTDHSMRERRRPKESDRYVEKESRHRGRSADIDENDSRAYRDRGEKQHRGEKQYRPPSRDDEDRYEGRHRYGDRRNHRANKYRYDTDASYYDKEDSRYELSQRRNGKYHDDRYYKSKDYERDQRDERERYRGRDNRYSDYDSMNKSRRTKDRSSNGSERGDYPSGYYHPTVAQPFGYDPYSAYYQHQQYYENLRRTNPVAYAEWYNRYFAGRLPTAASVATAASERGRESGRESVHSGRSSSKDNDRTQQKMGSLDDAPMTSMEPERLTPLKFTSTHSSASFQNGLLVCVKQKYLPTNEFQNNVHLLKFALNNQTKRLYQTFPGPLTPITHTKQVIEFCLDQIRNGPNVSSLNSRSTSNSMSSLQSVDQSTRASFVLLWNFLILLLRQRGVFVGSDIAELLLKNKEEFPCEQQQLNSTKLSTAQKESGEALSDVESKDESNDAFSNESEQINLSEKEITEKFREFLLYGSINEALEWATENNLWGHALFLASKMDRRSHANVMIKFANKLPLADPLQTLYQLKSGRVPLSVTSTQDEKWGDWRPHLAMIISNPSQSNAELDRKAIITMGDTLHNRGDLFAAQFCYLMAKVEFSKYSDVKHDASVILNSTTNAVRLILLGASCYKSSFAEFATDEAIIMTEIYEYACTLANSQYSIVEFQPYKYLLGTRMLDYGFHLKSLLYMEQVAFHIQKNPTHYERSFIEKVYNMADKLKYYDPVLEKNLDSLNEEDGSLQNSGQLQWQLDLLNILGQTPIALNNEMPMNLQQPMSSAPVKSNANEIDHEFSQINQQFQDLNLQYQNSTYEYASMGAEASPVQTTDVNTAPNYIDPSNHYTKPNSYETHQKSDFYVQQQQQHHHHQQQHEFSGNNSGGYSDQQAQPTYQPHTYNEPFAYEGASNYSANEVPKPTISMPNSFSNKPGFYDDADSSETNNQNGSEKNNHDPNKSAQDTKKKSTPNGTNDNSKSGWIGGFINKLTFKPKNQMKLPDDKNPSIIWDEQNKRWINKDQDEDEKESFKPPPKLTELPAMAHMPNDLSNISNIPAAEPMSSMQSYGNPPMPIPNSQDSNPTMNSNNDPGAAAKIPSLQSNMFKMQRNKTLKKSYVDVFNPSGAAPKNDTPILAPMMPTLSTQTNLNYFVPAAVPSSNQQNQDDQPAFYNPNQYGGYSQQ